MTIYGYARVSTADQSLDAQLAELKAAGCKKIFQEKVTGKHRDRPQLDHALKVFGAGDVGWRDRASWVAHSIGIPI